MLKYINETTNNVVYLNTSDKEHVNLEGYREMSPNEVKKHESNPYLDYMAWDEVGASWVDKRTQKELIDHNRSTMPNLTKREFRKKLRDAQLFDQVEAYIKSSNDGYLQDAWEYADFFARLDPFIIDACEKLGLSPELVDEIWIG